MAANVFSPAAVAGIKVQKFGIFPKDDFLILIESLDSRNCDRAVLADVVSVCKKTLLFQLGSLA
jgi:hypothetical protein